MSVSCYTYPVVLAPASPRHITNVTTSRNFPDATANIWKCRAGVRPTLRVCKHFVLFAARTALCANLLLMVSSCKNFATLFAYIRFVVLESRVASCMRITHSRMHKNIPAYAWQASDKSLHGTCFSVCLIAPLSLCVKKNSPLHIWELLHLN
jgi:hypothetical protein